MPAGVETRSCDTGCISSRGLRATLGPAVGSKRIFMKKITQVVLFHPYPHPHPFFFFIYTDLKNDPVASQMAKFRQLAKGLPPCI